MLFNADRPVDRFWPPVTFWAGELACNGRTSGFEVDASLYVLTVVKGLKVTVRDGRFSRCDVLEAPVRC